jgi:PAS domain-containing protein
MTRHLDPHQVLLLLGTALAIGAVMVLIIYALHRSMRQRKREMRSTARARSARDESTLLLASLQGLVATLKSREKQLEALLREAEQRADASARALETIVRTSPQGLMVFDREGFLAQANQAARNILEVDIWARRRYGEIFGPDSPLARAVRSSFENAKSPQRIRIDYVSPSGRKHTLGLSLSPFQGRGGEPAGLVCMVAILPGQGAR